MRRPLDLHRSDYTGNVRLARIFSNIFSPPSVFAAAGFVTAWVEVPSVGGLLQAAIYGMLASLLPVLYVVYLYKTGQVSDLHMSSTEERTVPYLIGLGGAALAYFGLVQWGNTPLLTTLILIHLTAMAALSLINRWWLISAHVTSITALAAFAGVVGGWHAALWLLPLVALTVGVRHFLKRHTPGEMASGFVLGIAVVAFLKNLGAILP